MYDQSEYPTHTPSFEQPVTPPASDPDAGGLLTVQYSPTWTPYLLGALTQLLQRATWDTTDPVVAKLAQDRAMALMNILAGGLASIPGIGLSKYNLTRYNSTTHTVQTSHDGGATYQDDAGANPQNQITFPAVSGTGAQCNAAASLVRYVSNVVSGVITNINAGETAAALGAFLVSLLLELGPFGILIDLAVLLGITLIGIGASVISAALTNAVYDTLLCILFCNIAPDGSFSATTKAQVEADISAQIGGTSATVLNAIFDLMGYGGMSNAARAGLNTGNCSGCTSCNHCYKLDLTASDGIALGYHNSGGQYAGAWSGVFINASNINDVYGYWAFPARVFVKTITLEFYKAAGSGGNDVNHLNALKPATSYIATTIASNNTNPKAPNVRQTKTITLNADCDGVGFDLNTGQTNSIVQIYSIKITYTGNALYADNC